MTGGQGLIQSELSKKLLVSRANITGLIERLEKEDLVVRTNDSGDKRVFRVYLTARGSDLMNAFLPKHNELLFNVMSILDRNEKEILISLMRKLNRGLNSI
jgi:Transcriptional regulators